MAHWTAGLSNDELSRKGFSLPGGVETIERHNACIVAGALSRIAASLESIDGRLRDLCDPLRDEKVAAAKQRRADADAREERWETMNAVCAAVVDRVFFDHKGDRLQTRVRNAAEAIIGIRSHDAAVGEKASASWLEKFAAIDWLAVDVEYFTQAGSNIAARITETLNRRRAEESAADRPSPPPVATA